MRREVKIGGLVMDVNTNTPVIILRDINSEALLPIWITDEMANRIAMLIEKVESPRPLTHDLIRNLITAAGAWVECVVITELRESTYYAVIEITESQEKKMMLDARPSDAIALALRMDCPIYIEDEVFRAANSNVTEEKEAEDDEWPDVVGDAGDLPM